MPGLYVVPFGVPADQALCRCIRDAKAGDPLAPVTVAGPSNYAHLSLRRRLGVGPLRIEPCIHDGLVNVRFMALARIAELLGAPRLARNGKKLLTDALRAESVRLALQAAPGVFAPVKGHAATAASLETTFRDLRDSTPESRRNVAARSDRARDVVALFDAFEERIAEYYDDTDLLDAAAEEVAAGSTALKEIGHVILFLPRGLAPAEERFIHALAAEGRATVILGASGDADADAPMRAMLDRLKGALGEGTEAAGPVPKGHALVSVPDPEEEVRAVVRKVSERLEAGQPLYRVGILYRAARPYALLAHEQLSAAGIPHNGHDTATLAQSAAGATLLGILRLADADFAREAVIDWLAGANILDQHGEPVPAHAWGKIARDAGIVKSLDRWLERLDRYRAHWEGEMARLAADPEEGQDSPRALRLEHRIADIRRLREFMEELGKKARPQGLSTWTALAGWARGILDRYLGPVSPSSPSAEAEMEDGDRVREALDDLQALAVLDSGADLSVFRRALESALSTGSRRLGRWGQGVFVGALKDAVGMRFDEVFILGMTEGAFPPRPREDPLLPDRERAAGPLRLRALAAADERRDYLVALASADRVTLVTSRANPRAQQETLPCPWFLETATALSGGPDPIFSRDVEGLAAEPFMEFIPSFHSALLAGRFPASPQEHDLATLLRAWCAGQDLSSHACLAGCPSAGRGFRAVACRGGADLTAWDGRLPAGDDLLPSDRRPISPTSLETWARCPFQYLLGSVLRVAATERPEDHLAVRGLDRGNIFHGALEAFFRARLGIITPDTVWTEDDMQALVDLADELVDQAIASGVGEAFSWDQERRAIRRELKRFLTQDQKFRKDLG